MDLKVVLIPALPLMTLLCFLSMASSAATPTIDYIHPQDGFYGDQPRQLNMLQEGRRTPLWMDVQALLSFKKHIKHPSRQLSNWTTGNWEEACSWYGITCAHQNPRVVAIILPGLNLTGTLSPSIGSLSLLHTLNLSHHNLSGEIPLEFGQLKELRVLDLSFNHQPTAYGFASPSFNHMLTGSYSMLTGSIPTSLSNCTSLERLALSSNNFTGSIPKDFGRLVKLEELDLSYNSLTGHIPPTLSNCTKLSILFLSSNNFTGSIPTVLGRLVKLEQLDLSHNSLSGHIPPTLSNCTKLWTLILSSNYFTGTIPTMFGHLVELQHIDLGSNSLSGHVPPTLGNCTRLQSLILNVNRLSGRIPESIFGNSLKIFEVSRNSLVGDLEMRFPVSMVIFSVYFNNFTGCFPSSLANCTKLKVLDLSKNKFVGEIPPFLSYPQLQILSMGHNKFCGGIPLWITNLLKLEILDLSNNKFSGRIPDNEKLQGFAEHNYTYWNTYWKEKILYYALEIVIQGSEYLLVEVFPTEAILDLSNNNFIGEIPTSIGNLGGLRLLNLSWNQLEGQIPPSLGNISALEQLDLAKNNLWGRIPQELSQLHWLGSLNFSYNNLCGSIPQEGTEFDTFDVTSFQGNKCLCGLPLPSCKEKKCLCGSPLPSCKENKTKSVECVDKKNNVKVGWLHYIDEKMSLIGLGIGAITGFGVVVIVFIVWKKARDWMVPPNIPKRFYGEYRLPT